MKRKHPFVIVAFEREIKLSNKLTRQQCMQKAAEIKAEYEKKYPELKFSIELCNTISCRTENN